MQTSAPLSVHSDVDSGSDPACWRSAVVVIGHPGHELRVHGWMEIARPLVCVLTDGSGSSGQARLESTTREEVVVEHAAADADVSDLRAEQRAAAA